MRQIGTVEGESAARQLSDLLIVEGIGHQIDPGEDGTFALWILDEDHLEKAAELLERWRRDPSIAETPEVTEQARAIRRKADRELHAARKRLARSRPRLGGHMGIAPVTLTLIAISVVVAIVTKLGDDPGPLRWLFIDGFDPRTGFFHTPPWIDIQRGEWWRLVTPIFIHFGILHIVFNVWWMKDLGTAIERHHGLRVFLPLLILTAIGPNVAQYAFTGNPQFGGLSGVVYGLLGYIWMRGKFDPLSGLHLPQEIVVLMIGWFLVCAVGIIPHVANWAHGAGLGIGMAYGFVLARLFPSFRLR